MLVDVNEWLNDVRKLDLLIDAKIAEMQRLYDLSTKCTQSIDGMPKGSGKTDKVGSMAPKIADLYRETEDALIKYTGLKKDVLSAIEKLPGNEYGAIHMHYIRYMTWEQVAEEMQCSVSQAKRYAENGKNILKINRNGPK